MSDQDLQRHDAPTRAPDEELPYTEGGPHDTPPDGDDRSASLWSDAWRQLRRSPVFLISAFFIIVFIVMAIAPQLFTNEPYPQGVACPLTQSLQRPSAQDIFGFDIQGCNYYAKTIYGARASILVGLSVTLSAVVVAVILGSLAGYYGKWVDAIIARVTDVWFAIPVVLGSIVMITALRNADADSNFLIVWIKSLTDFFDDMVNIPGIGIVWLTLVVLGWPTMLRLLRSSVIAVRESEYVEAARALGAKDSRIIIRHILPNAMAPVIVYATITVGVIISAEATLSFLGVGLQLPAISWGLMISNAQNRILGSPHLLLFPGLFLSVAVFSFILMGDALRDALDPRLR
jgi:oligopeptide transport system permease protein